MPVLLIILFGLVVIGCSTPPVCVAGGLSFFSSMPVDCAKVARNVELARSIIIARGLATEAELDASAVGVAAIIRTELVWDREGSAYGEYLPGEVLLNQHMHNLAHELLHRLDDWRGTLSRDDPHAGWSTNGRDAASIEYNSRLEWLAAPATNG